MKIKFNNTQYSLVQQPYTYSTRFQCTFEKGENSYDDIVADTNSPEEITVYDDNDEIMCVYYGYDHRISFTIMSDICIEFDNTTAAQQIQEYAESVIDQQIRPRGEKIGEPASQRYDRGDTFIADGEYYRATVDIERGDILVEGENCEKTDPIDDQTEE